ncbi:F-box protein [Stylophora pistillata]|uniref:F-box protein n=1 Tax=Stylophora pistillata TaxID=50429 RepID=A0A2B4RSP7_STYPI|nr:F-box protein [Stylophora pistillata]
MKKIMAAPAKKKGKIPEFSVETLSRSKHGIACVANIDVRGNVPIYAIFKRPAGPKNSKAVFDFAAILGYIGGEFRDGFCQRDLKEGESVRFLQSYISSLAERRIGMCFVPVEQVAALFLQPLYQKALRKGFVFPDRETTNAFECFKQVAHFCRFSSPEELFRIRLKSLTGRDITKAKDAISGDLNLWTIDNFELAFYKCPLPPDPPNYPTGDFDRYEEFPGFLQQAGWVIQAYSEAEGWKKTAAVKLTSPENYERFSGMAKQQALWYIWKGDLEKAAVMVHSWRRFDEDCSKGKVLDVKNPAMDAMLNITHNDLSNEGLYEGYRKPDARLIRGSKCDICSSSDVYIYDTEHKFIRPGNVRTCVDYEGNAEFGSEEIRNNMAKLLLAIYKFGTNHDFETSATHCFKEALHIFLEHSFNNLYWRIKPTKAMKEAVEMEAVHGFVKALQQIKSLSDIFSSRLDYLVNTDIKRLMEEDETSVSSGAGDSAKTVGIDLLSKTLIPSFASEFQGKWTLLPEAKRQKILTTDSKALIKTCKDTFAKLNKIYNRQTKIVENQNVEETTTQEDDDSSMGDSNGGDDLKNADGLSETSNKPKQNDESNGDIPDVCPDDLCPCKDPKMFYKHFVAVLAGDENPVPFFKCAPTGDVIMNEEMCMDKDGNNVGRMVAFDFEHVNTTMNTIVKERFSSCPRLALLCKKVCHNIYPLLIMSLCQGFVELQKKDGVKVELYTCPACGNKETKPGEFKRCGGCKTVYYCGRKCQAQHWKAGHKQQCDTSAKQAL